MIEDRTTSEFDHRTVAAATHNRCWDLLEASQRDDRDDAELLTAAFTSRYHWYAVGDDEQKVIADWMVSRAAATTGDGRIAVAFGERAIGRVGGGEHPAWLKASLHEGMARAFAAAGDAERRQEHLDLAVAELAAETDDEDRQLIEEQIASVPEAS